MKFLVLGIVCLIFGCSSINSRQIAGYEEKNLSHRGLIAGLRNLTSLSQHLFEIIPEKGHPKKILIDKFISDLKINLNKIEQLSIGVNDLSSSWIPSEQHPKRAEIILVLGEIVQSYTVMNQLGVYLTSSGVMDEDSKDQEYYFNLLAKTVEEVDSQISRNILLYQSEDKEAQQQLAKLKYSQFLASVVRENLSKVITRNNKNIFIRVDRAFKEVETLTDTEKAKDFVNTKYWIFAKDYLSQLSIEGSSDIDGFQDDVDLTLKTKFGSSMIHFLFESLR